MSDLDEPVAEAIVSEGIQARLDAFATSVFPSWLPSKKRAKKAIKSGEVRLDGALVETSRFVKEGQRVTLHAGTVLTPTPLTRELEVAFENVDLAIVIKPAGLLTNGNRFATLERALSFNLAPSPAVDALPWPRPVHRLDRATSGLVVCAKTRAAQVWLGRAFQERTVRKRYRAIVSGKFEGQRVVDSPIDGRNAQSTVLAIEHVRSLHVDWITVVDLLPSTGRTHQLRRHCAELGHPILGDRLYTSDQKLLKRAGLFLSAVELEIPRPDGQQIRVQVAPPPKFTTFVAREQKRWWNHHSAQDDADSSGN